MKRNTQVICTAARYLAMMGRDRLKLQEKDSGNMHCCKIFGNDGKRSSQITSSCSSDPMPTYTHNGLASGSSGRECE